MLSLLLAQELLLVLILIALHILVCVLILILMLIIVVDYGDGRSNVAIYKWVCRGSASRLAREAHRYARCGRGSRPRASLNANGRSRTMWNSLIRRVCGMRFGNAALASSCTGGLLAGLRPTPMNYKCPRRHSIRGRANVVNNNTTDNNMHNKNRMNIVGHI